MSAKKLTLTTWAARQFEKPPKIATLRNWAASGRICPQPVKIGRDWMVDPGAEYVPRTSGAAANDAELSPRVRAILNGG